MQASDMETHFARSDGRFVFAGWARPIAPVVFGVDDSTLEIFKGGLDPVCALTGHRLVATDPDLGANFRAFVFRDWAELLEVPELDRPVPDPASLVARVEAAQANQYRLFHLDDLGAIRAVLVCLRMDPAVSSLAAGTLALDQVAQTMLLRSDTAFNDRATLAKAGDRTVLRPEIADPLRVADAPVLPHVAQDPFYALRLAARMGAHR